MRDWDRDGNGGARRLARALALSALLASLAGCDVAVAGLLASRGSKSSSSGGAAAPDTTFKVYVRDLPSAAALDLDNERDAIIGTGGVPGSSWTLVGSFTTSRPLDIGAVAGGPFNAILILAPEAQDYRIDAIERLDANGISVESATAAGIRSDEVTSEAEAAGKPDGKTADTDSLPAAKAFLFARFAAPLDDVQVTLAGSSRAGGDVDFALTLPRLGNQLGGGVAVTSSGQISHPFVDATSRNVLINRISSDAASVTTTVIEADTNVTGGIPCALVDEASDRLYVSFVRAPNLTSEENLRVNRYALGTPGFATLTTELAIVGIERVEANALALNPIGEIQVAGGAPALGGTTHWLRKVNLADTAVWTTPTALNGTGHYWYGVACDSSGNVFAVGDTSSAAGDWQIQRFTSAGTASPASPITEGGTGLDRALTVGAGESSVYVGGFFTRAAEGRNGLLFKYNAADLSDDPSPSFPIEINGFSNDDDEILDIAVDGSDVFVVGYTTVTSPAQGENWFVRKYTTAGALVWERTYDHGFGDDRAVSVAVGSTFVVVAGEVTISGGTTDLHVRKYVR